MAVQLVTPVRVIGAVRFAVLASSFVFALGGCAGGGPSTPASFAMEGESSSDPVTVQTYTSSVRTTGFWQRGNNPKAFDPMVDLPVGGAAGFRVGRPTGAKVVVHSRLANAPAFVVQAEPILRLVRSNAQAWERLEAFSDLLLTAVHTAYKQWARHLRPQTINVDIQFGNLGRASCHHSAIGCYIPRLNAVVLADGWLLDNYRKWKTAFADRRPDIEADVFFEILRLATHEAGHQFGYRHPYGTTDGCGDGVTRCHAPYGSGSVLSYDHLFGSPTRYAPTKEDVAHIQGGWWNDDPIDRYTVSKTSFASTISSYGYWLDHEFYVTGWTGFGSVDGGSGFVRNEMVVQPFVVGAHSRHHGLRGSASWVGDLIGYDLRADVMSPTVADAALTYHFPVNQLAARVDRFRVWHSDGFRPSRVGADYRYLLRCSADGCANHRPGEHTVLARFYRHGYDPSAYVAGSVNDHRREYAGAFAAEKLP